MPRSRSPPSRSRREDENRYVERDRRDRRSSRERDRDRDLKRRRHRSSRSRSPPRRRHVVEAEHGKPPYHEAGSSRSRRDDHESARPPRNRPSPESRSPRRRDNPLPRPPMGRRSPPRVSRSQSPNSAERDDRKKLEPDFKPSGILAAATKTVKKADGTTTVLKYHEPPEARKPSQGWRLYVFKGEQQTDVLHIVRQSAYLFGRDRLVVDVPTDHPSCSKQHAVVQFRQVTQRNEWGDTKTTVKPFVIDLESTNGTFVNGTEVPTSCYYELKHQDVLKFGESAREYVVMNVDEAAS